MKTLCTLILASLLTGLVFSNLQAQTPDAAPPTQAEREARQKALIDKIESFGWTRSGFGKLGTRAQVGIPQGYRFTDGNGAREMMKISDNFPTNKELGLLTTEGLGHWIIFEFDDSGYVKDDEKDQLDADALLKIRKEGQEASNERRKEMGMEELHVLGWAVPPRFNDKTKNLEWALRLGSASGGESINYETRLLGRSGVMEVTLVCTPEEMQDLMNDYQSIMASFEYLDGEKYAEYRAGDKMAKYGLTALVAGGGAFAAAKMGLFGKLGALIAKMGKLVILAVIGIAAALKKMFSMFFGKRA